jgi:hypothetical protein
MKHLRKNYATYQNAEGECNCVANVWVDGRPVELVIVLQKNPSAVTIYLLSEFEEPADGADAATHAKVLATLRASLARERWAEDFLGDKWPDKHEEEP